MMVKQNLLVSTHKEIKGISDEFSQLLLEKYRAKRPYALPSAALVHRKNKASSRNTYHHVYDRRSYPLVKVVYFVTHLHPFSWIKEEKSSYTLHASTRYLPLQLVEPGEKEKNQLLSLLLHFAAQGKHANPDVPPAILPRFLPKTLLLYGQKRKAADSREGLAREAAQKAESFASIRLLPFSAIQSRPAGPVANQAGNPSEAKPWLAVFPHPERLETNRDNRPNRFFPSAVSATGSRFAPVLLSPLSFYFDARLFASVLSRLISRFQPLLGSLRAVPETNRSEPLHAVMQMSRHPGNGDLVSQREMPWNSSISVRVDPRPTAMGGLREASNSLADSRNSLIHLFFVLGRRYRYGSFDANTLVHLLSQMNVTNLVSNFLSLLLPMRQTGKQEGWERETVREHFAEEAVWHAAQFYRVLKQNTIRNVPGKPVTLYAAADRIRGIPVVPAIVRKHFAAGLDRRLSFFQSMHLAQPGEGRAFFSSPIGRVILPSGRIFHIVRTSERLNWRELAVREKVAGPIFQRLTPVQGMVPLGRYSLAVAQEQSMHSLGAILAFAAATSANAARVFTELHLLPNLTFVRQSQKRAASESGPLSVLARQQLADVRPFGPAPFALAPLLNNQLLFFSRERLFSSVPLEQRILPAGRQGIFTHTTAWSPPKGRDLRVFLQGLAVFRQGQWPTLFKVPSHPTAPLLPATASHFTALPLSARTSGPLLHGRKGADGEKAAGSIFHWQLAAAAQRMVALVRHSQYAAQEGSPQPPGTVFVAGDVRESHLLLPSLVAARENRGQTEGQRVREYAGAVLARRPFPAGLPSVAARTAWAFWVNNQLAFPSMVRAGSQSRAGQGSLRADRIEYWLPATAVRQLEVERVFPGQSGPSALSPRFENGWRTVAERDLPERMEKAAVFWREQTPSFFLRPLLLPAASIWPFTWKAGQPQERAERREAAGGTPVFHWRPAITLRRMASHIRHSLVVSQTERILPFRTAFALREVVDLPMPPGSPGLMAAGGEREKGVWTHALLELVHRRHTDMLRRATDQTVKLLDRIFPAVQERSQVWRQEVAIPYLPGKSAVSEWVTTPALHPHRSLTLLQRFVALLQDKLFAGDGTRQEGKASFPSGRGETGATFQDRRRWEPPGLLMLRQMLPGSPRFLFGRQMTGEHPDAPPSRHVYATALYRQFPVQAAVTAEVLEASRAVHVWPWGRLEGQPLHFARRGPEPELIRERWGMAQTKPEWTQPKLVAQLVNQYHAVSSLSRNQFNRIEQMVFPTLVGAGGNASPAVRRELEREYYFLPGSRTDQIEKASFQDPFRSDWQYGTERTHVPPLILDYYSPRRKSEKQSAPGEEEIRKLQNELEQLKQQVQTPVLPDLDGFVKQVMRELEDRFKLEMERRGV